MLETQDRRLFLEALKAPSGYEIDSIIGTTYSLDILALLTVPLSFTLSDWQDEEGRPKLDPLKLLEAVRRHAGKLALFCQAGLIGMPRKHRNIYAYLEPSIVEVQAPDSDGVFHPKVWVCRYTPRDQEQNVRYKAVIQSRNMTFDRSWDTMLVLDGELLQRRNAISINHPLADFIGVLPELAVHPVVPSVQRNVDLIRDELKRVSFEYPEPFEELAFWPLGIPKHRKWPFAERMDRTLIISPFISGSMLRRLGQNGRNHILVTREESLSQIMSNDLISFESTHVLHDSGIPDPADEPISSFEPELTVGANLGDEISSLHEGLHSKLYVADAGWDAHMWIGSANATLHGFERNVEFLVELRGKKSRCGIDAVLGRHEDKFSLRRLLKECSPDQHVSTPEEAERRRLEKQLESVRRLLASADFHVEAIPDDTQDSSYRHKLHVPEISSCLLIDTEVICWPLSMKESFSAVPLIKGPTGLGQQNHIFDPVEDAAITSFIAFSITLRGSTGSQQVRFVCNYPLSGAPEDRNDRILRSILRNREDLLRYLLMLLSSDDEGSLDIVELAASEERNNSSERHSFSLVPLYEILLQALVRQPSQLDVVEELINSLRKTEDGLSLLPEGFLQIWEPIWAVRKEALL